MIGLLLKHGADPNALNKNLLTPIAFTNGRQKDEYFLDSCISQVITFEAFCNSVRGGQNRDSRDNQLIDKTKRTARR